MLAEMPEAEIMAMYDEEISQPLYDSLSEKPVAEEEDMIDNAERQPKIFAPELILDADGNPVDKPIAIDPYHHVYPDVRHSSSDQDKEIADQRIDNMAGDPTQYPHLNATHGDNNVAPVSLWSDAVRYTFEATVTDEDEEAQDYSVDSNARAWQDKRLYQYASNEPQNVDQAETLVNILLADVTGDTPKGYNRATNAQNKPLWQPSITNELNGFVKRKALELCKRSDVIKHYPSEHILQRWVWVFSLKYNDNGSIINDSRKSRLSVDGSQCIPGIHFDPTQVSSVVMSCAAFRILLTIAAKFQMRHRVTDFVKAFLSAPIDREIYTEVPPGYLEHLNMDPTNPEDYVTRLRCQIYGIPQANYFFSKGLFETFQSAQFSNFRLEPAIYYKNHDRSKIPSEDATITDLIVPTQPTQIRANFEICTTHVDDCNHFIADETEHQRLMDILNSVFEQTDQTHALKNLGKEFRFNDQTASFHLAVKGILLRVMNKLKIENVTNGKVKKLDLKLLTDKRPYCLLTADEQKGLDENSRPTTEYALDLFTACTDEEKIIYRKLIGVGNYVVCQVRPDNSVEQSLLSKYTSRPERRHMNGIQQMFRNMLITIDLELQIGGRLPFYQQINYRAVLPTSYLQQQSSNAIELISMTDSSLHNHTDDRATQLGHINFIDGTPYSWKSYHSNTTLNSSRDAELVALYDNMFVPQRAHEMLTALKIPIIGNIPLLMTDNNPVVDNLANTFSTIEKAYLDTKLKSLKDEERAQTIKVIHIPRTLNLADSFCKSELTTEEIKLRKDTFFASTSIIPIMNPLGSFGKSHHVITSKSNNRTDKEG